MFVGSGLNAAINRCWLLQTGQGIYAGYADMHFALNFGISLPDLGRSLRRGHAHRTVDRWLLDRRCKSHRWTVAIGVGYSRRSGVDCWTIEYATVHDITRARCDGPAWPNAPHRRSAAFTLLDTAYSNWGDDVCNRFVDAERF
jgi:hypothetical protein